MFHSFMNTPLAALLLRISTEPCDPAPQIEEIKSLSRDDALLINSP